MIKRIIVALVLLFFAWIFAMTIAEWRPDTDLGALAASYVDREPGELGAANLVTAIVVTYRGLDTLGEVSVLFLAAAGVGLLLSGSRDNGGGRRKARPSSEILSTGTDALVPLIIMFGTYIFIGGHLSPGGGFQGGAVAASAFLLLLLTYTDHKTGHGVLRALESLSGAGYVAVGVLGLVLAGGFLDSRFLGLGSYGRILSAGAIPVIYTLIGLKVGAELSGVLDNMRGRR